MGEKVWNLSRERFVELWNAAGSLEEVTAWVKDLVGPPAPRWAVQARAVALRKEGGELKPLPAGKG